MMMKKFRRNSRNVYGLKLEQMDVVTAFLNPDVEEEIFNINATLHRCSFTSCNSDPCL
jgi:hypothetical protein